VLVDGELQVEGLTILVGADLTDQVLESVQGIPVLRRKPADELHSGATGHVACLERGHMDGENGTPLQRVGDVVVEEARGLGRVEGAIVEHVRHVQGEERVVPGGLDELQGPCPAIGAALDLQVVGVGTVLQGRPLLQGGQHAGDPKSLVRAPVYPLSIVPKPQA